MNMIKEGSIVIIKMSEALRLEKLTKLAGREAEIIEELTSIQRLNKGYLVRLTEECYLGEDIWFIPQESIDDDE